jgi:serine phosphatase RsbU (regulator of sigma subunit)
MRLRGGRVEPVALRADPPFGIVQGQQFEVQPLPLEPGDRLIFLTDGMLERNADSVDLPAAILETRPLHPREAVRALADRVLDATGDTLSDDATVLCLDWHGGHGRARASIHGAERRRASEPLD